MSLIRKTCEPSSPVVPIEAPSRRAAIRRSVACLLLLLGILPLACSKSSTNDDEDTKHAKKSDDQDKRSKDDDEEPKAASDASFFAGEMPSKVKMKGTKEWAIKPNELLFEPVAGYRGGRLPGQDYMAMSPDQTVAFRVMTSTGMVSQLGCKDLAATIKMAPTRGKNVQELSPPKLVKVGRNGFAAREGACSADGPNGAVEVRFIDINRKDAEGEWHYAVLVTYPKDDAAKRDEAMAWARSVVFNGHNAYSLP